jgi:hypothetical protein
MWFFFAIIIMMAMIGGFGLSLTRAKAVGATDQVGPRVLQVVGAQQQKVKMAALAMEQGFVLLNQGEPLSGSQVFLACSKASSLLYAGILNARGEPEWNSIGERVTICPAG